jgi:hypothetical protein
MTNLFYVLVPSLLLSFAAASAYADKEGSAEVKTNSVVVRVVQRDEETPADKFLVAFSPQGDLRGIDFDPIDDLGLKRMLHEMPADKSGTCYVLLKSRHEEDTSLATLATVLERIKQAADPKRNTVIYLSVKGFSR